MKSEAAHLYYNPPTSHSSSSALASASLQGAKASGTACSQQMHNEEPVSTTIGSPPQQRKRIKRDTISSISSTEDDIDSVGGENELERSGGRLLQPTSTSNFHFHKSPPGLQSPSSIWPVSQESHHDLGKRIICLTTIINKFYEIVTHTIVKIITILEFCNTHMFTICVELLGTPVSYRIDILLFVECIIMVPYFLSATKVVSQSSPPPPALSSPHLIRSRIEGAVGFMPVSASGSSHILQDRNSVGSPLSPTSLGSHLPSRIVPLPALNRQTHSPLSISPGECRPIYLRCVTSV